MLMNPAINPLPSLWIFPSIQGSDASSNLRSEPLTSMRTDGAPTSETWKSTASVTFVLEARKTRWWCCFPQMGRVMKGYV